MVAGLKTRSHEPPSTGGELLRVGKLGERGLELRASKDPYLQEFLFMTLPPW